MLDEPLSLSHKSLLYEPLRTSGTLISEYCFANLYLFRRTHDYRVCTGDEPFIKGRAYAGFTYAMPVRDIRLIDKRLLYQMINTCGNLFPIPEEWLPVFAGSGYTIDHNDDDSDYLHLLSKLSTYSGKKLHSKKNLLNQFLDTYTAEALPLTDDRLDDARSVLEAWSHTVDEPQEKTDYGACSEALSLYEELTLCGGIYYVEGKPAGFVMGEELDGSTFVIHFAKADRTFKGIYQYMYRHFAQIMPSKYAAFNFEQDLGLDSLRQAKASYQPDKMVVKYRVGRT